MPKQDDELSLAKQRIEDLDQINTTLQNQITELQNRDQVNRRVHSVELALAYAGSVPEAVASKDVLISTARDIYDYLSE